MPRRGETSYHENAHGVIPRSQLIPLELEGIKRAWDFVMRERQRHKLPLTPEFLRKLHRIGFGWIIPEIGGRWRKAQVRVSHHEPPSAHRIPELMVNYCLDLKEQLKHVSPELTTTTLEQLISLLAWAHHRFLWIHPFQDYNGRIARLLINCILFNLGLPPIELKVETPGGRKRYIEALQAADQGAYQKLERLIQEALEEAAKELGV